MPDLTEILNRLQALAASAPGDERFARAIAWVRGEIAATQQEERAA